MSRRLYSGWALCLIAAIAASSMPSCAGTKPSRDASIPDQTLKEGVHLMLEEIYSSRKPVRFEQIDVSPIVLEHIPLGTDKAAVLASFESSATTKVIENSSAKLVLRDNKGRAMLDPDARSIVMTFSFDLAGKLTAVQALHLKNQ